jgi:hypothetical protein
MKYYDKCQNCHENYPQGMGQPQAFMEKCAAACEHYGSAYEKKGSYQYIIYKSDSVPGNLIYELLVVVSIVIGCSPDNGSSH